MDSRKLKCKTVQTEINSNSKLFNAGFRRHLDSLRVPNFIENITQSLLYSSDLKDSWILIGGDGRTYSKEFLEKLLQVLAGNAVRRVFVSLKGCIPTPVAACVMRERRCHIGFILSGGHHPAGDNGYLGLKIISPPGIPIREEVIAKTNRIVKSLQSFSICERLTYDFNSVRETECNISGRKFSIEVIDIVQPYLKAIEKMFDFDSIKEYIKNDFKMKINCSNGVTGSIARCIFVEKLGVPEKRIINSDNLEDFGQLSPDPNQLNYSSFIKHLKEKEYNFGAVLSPDGCRCMIIGEEGFVVRPSDTLAIIAAKNNSIPFFQQNKLETVVRTICTSQAIDRVADSLSILKFEVPVGWQNFSGAMLPAKGKAILYGEESFGLGVSSDSFCSGDRDGIWTILAWLSILAECKKSVKNVVEEHWSSFGRSFFGRLDFHNVPHQHLETFLCFLREKNSLRFDKIKTGSYAVEYVDPFGIDPRFQTEEAKKRNEEIVFEIENYIYPFGFIKKSLLKDDQYQIYQIQLMEQASLILRRSESTSNSSTFRFYIEYSVEPGDEKIFEDREKILQPFIKAAMKIMKIEDFFTSEIVPVFV